MKRNNEESDEDEVVFIGEQKTDNSQLSAFQSIDWLKKFHPKNIAELAVHPKKLEDLKNWFNHACAKTQNRILVIEGPTGCAKATALKLVAKDCGYNVNEWINSTDIETGFYQEESTNREYTTYENQATKFADFLLRTSRYNSVFDTQNRIIMIKDFPNTFLKKTEEFWTILKEYSRNGLSPLVFIVTETNSKSLNISHNLFPAKIRIENKIDTIAFNSISATLMKKAVKRVVEMIEENPSYKPYFKRPNEAVMNNLIDQCQGDIRNAILNLNFASQQSNVKFALPKPVKPKKGSSKSKKTTLKNSDEGGLGKNEVISMMHGLGRVFHPKRELNEKTNYFELTHSPEILTESFRSQPTNFISMVQANYIKNFTDISSIAAASDIFSMSDGFESEYRDDQLLHVNLNLVIRAAMVLNAHPNGGFRTVAAKGDKKWRKAEEESKQHFIEASKSLNNGNIITRNDFFCDYNDYIKIISK